MACAAPTASSTKETTNYARLCRLLVDLGTEVLKDKFNTIHSSANLQAVLSANVTTLQSLRSRKIINPTQWGKLFPVISSSVSSASFDITLLMVLLRNVCGLAAPVKKTRRFCCERALSNSGTRRRLILVFSETPIANLRRFLVSTLASKVASQTFISTRTAAVFPRFL